MANVRVTVGFVASSAFVLVEEVFNDAFPACLGWPYRDSSVAFVSLVAEQLFGLLSNPLGYANDHDVAEPDQVCAFAE